MPKYLNAPLLAVTALLCVTVFGIMLIVSAERAESDKSDTAARQSESTITVYQPDRELHYVEPLRIKHGYPSRIYVEFSDSLEVVLSPCRDESSTDCFWWAPARGNGTGESYVSLADTVFPLKQGRGE